MTLILNNEDVQSVLTMEITMSALERAYIELTQQEAVCRPRIDIRIPTSDPARNYQWGTMEGGSTAGYFAIRMKSDVVYETQYNGVITQEKYCSRPGLFCSLILLTSIENGEPLAFLNDGHGHYVHPSGMALDPVGNLYLVEPTKHAIWKAPKPDRPRASGQG